MDWLTLGAGFAISALLAIIATRLAIMVARRYGVMNYPNPIIPQHKAPIAYLGGLGVVVGAAAGWALISIAVGPQPRLPAGLIAASTVYLAVGLYDDLFVLRPLRKLWLQVLTAVFSVWLGVTASPTNNTVITFVMSCIWIVAMVNAANLMDVCDGLLASVSLLVFSFFGFFGSNRLFPMVLAGACAGFLVFNRPPARIFLGDAGSHLLGVLLALLTLNEASARNHFSAYAAMILLSGVPLFEVVFLIAVRTRKRLPFWKGSPDHFALRLQAAGLSRVQTDVVACSAVTLLGAIAWGLLRNPAWPLQATLIAGAVLALLASACFLWRYEVKPEIPNRR
jgi:UDP-GlcNAc:undecaprenyl-phosphate GlcNAc-1-phosphate transferase